jgi:transposase-like protein
MKRAKVWYQQGTKPFFIAKRLTELGYRVSERTVRRWVETTGPSEEK